MQEYQLWSGQFAAEEKARQDAAQQSAFAQIVAGGDVNDLPFKALWFPLGPVLGVLPWNAPFWLAFRFCAPALMAGNTAVMKHDPHVPGCAAAIAGAFRAVGAPDGVFASLPAATPDVAGVIRDRRIRAVSFTGSDRAGAIVASVAASEIKPAVLELGGSDPFIVLADADLSQAAKVAGENTLILTAAKPRSIGAAKVVSAATERRDARKRMVASSPRPVTGKPFRRWNVRTKS